MAKTRESVERQKENRKKRIEIENMIKNESYIDWMKVEFGVMDMDEIRGDKEFFNDLIREIEKNRERAIVYDKEYLSSDLKEWRRMRDRKVMLRKIAEAARKKREGS